LSCKRREEKRGKDIWGEERREEEEREREGEGKEKGI
jgi:hypothetical protein